MSPTIDSTLRQRSKKSAIIAQASIVIEPKTYFKALNNKEALHWEKVIEGELASMYKNNIWTITTLFQGRTPIGC